MCSYDDVTYSEGTDLNLWMGESGTTTPLHFDNTHNLVYQAHGAKQFILFDPSHGHRFYEFPGSRPSSRVSQVNLQNPDLEQFPKFEGVQKEAWVIRLEPGDCLWVPRNFWHEVITPKDTRSSTSLNIWFTDPVNSVFDALIKEDKFAKAAEKMEAHRTVEDAALK